MTIPLLERAALSGQPTTYKLRLKDNTGAFQVLTGRTFSLVLMKTPYAYAATVAVETIEGVTASVATMTVPGVDNAALIIGKGSGEDYAGKIGETVDGAFVEVASVKHMITAGPDPDALPGGDGGAEGEAVVYTLLADTGLIEIAQQGAPGRSAAQLLYDAELIEAPTTDAMVVWFETLLVPLIGDEAAARDTAIAAAVTALRGGVAAGRDTLAKLSTALDTAVSAEVTARNAAISAAISALLGGAGAAYDTLKELGDLLVADEGSAAALAALVATKVAQTRTISAAGLATGGGDLTANRTITVPKASAADLSDFDDHASHSAPDDTKALTGLAVAPALAARVRVGRVPMSGWRNARPDPMAPAQRQMQKVQLGDEDMYVPYVGDSTTVGLYAGSADYSGEAKVVGGWDRNSPAAFARTLMNHGVLAAYECFFGDGNISGHASGFLQQFNPRILAAGSSWGVASGPAPTGTSLGGFQLTSNAGAVALGFRPRTRVSKFRMLTPRYSTGGLLNLQIDNETPVAVSEVGSDALIFTTVAAQSTVPALHTLKMDRQSGTTYVIGGHAWDDRFKQVHVLGMGWSGARSSHWAANDKPFRPRPALAALGAQLVVFNLGINPAYYQDDPNFYENMRGLIGDQTGSVILQSFFPSALTATTQAHQDAVQQMILQLGDEFNCVIFDAPGRYIDWATANARGFYYDERHPVAWGYSDAGAAVARLLLGI